MTPKPIDAAWIAETRALCERRKAWLTAEAAMSQQEMRGRILEAERVEPDIAARMPTALDEIEGLKAENAHLRRELVFYRDVENAARKALPAHMGCPSYSVEKGVQWLAKELDAAWLREAGLKPKDAP